MKKRLMAAVLSTAMAATMLLTGSISVQAADAAAANDPGSRTDLYISIAKR